MKEYIKNILGDKIISEINNIKKNIRLNNTEEINNNYTVYIHIIPKEISKYNWNKYYVGITRQNPKKRWGGNGCNYKESYFYNAIQKYGWNNIKHEIIVDKINKENACYLEKFIIKCLKSNQRKYGYNISDGGEGGNRRALKPVKQYDLLGNFIKEYPSAAEAARCLNIDRTHITKACKHGGMTFGFLWCYSKDEITRPYRRKCQKDLVQFDLNFNFINIYNSIKSASCVTGISSDCLSKCANGQNKTAGGFIWRYLNNLKESEITDSFLLQKYKELENIQ